MIMMMTIEIATIETVEIIVEIPNIEIIAENMNAKESKKEKSVNQFIAYIDEG
jgi:DNA gyrase inhibitor GyrI